MNRRRQKKLTRRLVGAMSFGDRADVEALLRAGADPNLADSDGTTPLYAGAVNGAAEQVGCLLDAGASPDKESGHGSEGTALCAAACWGHVDTVRELLAFGADPNLREDQGTGWSPLEWALRGPHSMTAELLRAAGADTGGAQ